MKDKIQELIKGVKETVDLINKVVDYGVTGEEMKYIKHIKDNYKNQYKYLKHLLRQKELSEDDIEMIKEIEEAIVMTQTNMKLLLPDEPTQRDKIDQINSLEDDAKVALTHKIITKLKKDLELETDEEKIQELKEKIEKLENYIDDSGI